MLLIPSIDLRGGACVRLLKGDFAAETRYELSAHELLLRYRSARRDAGCTWWIWTARARACWAIAADSRSWRAHSGLRIAGRRRVRSAADQ
jgi:hypothetical protein